jgi:hypothetical protein
MTSKNCGQYYHIRSSIAGIGFGRINERLAVKIADVLRGLISAAVFRRNTTNAMVINVNAQQRAGHSLIVLKRKAYCWK